MNKELIQKFLNKACWDEQAQHELEDWLNVEKFADMIVRECALTLESITVPVFESVEDWDKGYNKALATGAEVIKQHFGVEE